MRLDPAGSPPPPNRSRRPPAPGTSWPPLPGLPSSSRPGAPARGGSTGSVSGTITIAAVPSVGDAPIYLAQKNGLFAAEGLKNVVIKSYPNQAAELAALQSAQADIAASDYGNVFYQQSQSHDLRIVADGYDATLGVLQVLDAARLGDQLARGPGEPQGRPAGRQRPGWPSGLR